MSDVHVVLDQNWIDPPPKRWPAAKRSSVRKSMQSGKSVTLKEKGASFSKTPRFGSVAPSEIVEARKLEAQAEAAEKRRRKEQELETLKLLKEIEELQAIKKKQKEAIEQAWGPYASYCMRSSELPKRAQQTTLPAEVFPRQNPDSSRPTTADFQPANTHIRYFEMEDSVANDECLGSASVNGDVIEAWGVRKRGPANRISNEFEEGHKNTDTVRHQEQYGSADSSFELQASSFAVREDGAVECWMMIEIGYANAAKEQPNVFVEEMIEDLSRAAGIPEKRVGLTKIGYLDEEDIETREKVYLRMGKAYLISNENTDRLYIEAWVNRRLDDTIEGPSALEAITELLRQSRRKESLLLSDTIHCVHIKAFGSGQAEAYLQIHDEVSEDRPSRHTQSKKGNRMPVEGGQKQLQQYIPKLTVPKPFKFEATKKLKAKLTITQKRYDQYKKSLKEKENALRKMKFRAKPIPASTIVPKLKRLEEERQEKKRLLRESLEAKRASSAKKKNPKQKDGSEEEKKDDEEDEVIPSRLSTMIEEYNEMRRRQRNSERSHLNRKERLYKKAMSTKKSDIENFIRIRELGSKETAEQRAERIKKVAKKYLEESSMPPGLESRMLRRLLEKKKKKDREEKERKKAEAMKKKEGKSQRKPKDKFAVPNFRKIHEKNARKMLQLAEQKRALAVQTKPIAFKLSQPKKKKIVANEFQVPKFKSREFISRRKGPKPRQTKSTLLKMQKARERLVERHLLEENTKKTRLNSTIALNMRPTDSMKSNVKKHVRANGGPAQTQKQMLRRRVIEARSAQAQSDEEYKKWIASLKQKLENRPLLMEQDKRARDRLEARRRTLETIKESLEAAGITDLARYFDVEELEDLGLDHWLDKKLYNNTRIKAKKRETQSSSIMSMMQVTKNKCGKDNQENTKSIDECNGESISSSIENAAMATRDALSIPIVDDERQIFNSTKSEFKIGTSQKPDLLPVDVGSKKDSVDVESKSVQGSEGLTKDATLGKPTGKGVGDDGRTIHDLVEKNKDINYHDNGKLSSLAEENASTSATNEPMEGQNKDLSEDAAKDDDSLDIPFEDGAGVDPESDYDYDQDFDE